MTDRELMQQALDAMLNFPNDISDEMFESIKALRARLAEPEPEVRWDASAPLVVHPHPAFQATPPQQHSEQWWRHEVSNAWAEGYEKGRASVKQPEQEPVAWTERELELIDGMIEVQVIHAERCDSIPNRAMAEKQKGWDMERVELLRKIRTTAPPQQPERKLWLWKNFVDGKPEYWAFDNPYPTNLDNGDPQTLGQPCGYAIFKSSRDGSCGRTEEQVLREMKSVSTPPQRECADSVHDRREWQGLTDEEMFSLWVKCPAETEDRFAFARAIEAKLKEKNHG